MNKLINQSQLVNILLCHANLSNGCVKFVKWMCQYVTNPTIAQCDNRKLGVGQNASIVKMGS